MRLKKKQDCERLKISSYFINDDKEGGANIKGFWGFGVFGVIF